MADERTAPAALAALVQRKAVTAQRTIAPLVDVDELVSGVASVATEMSSGESVEAFPAFERVAIEAVLGATGRAAYEDAGSGASAGPE